MALWLALTSTTNPSEAIVGAGVTAVAAGLATAVQRHAPISFVPRAGWLMRSWHVPVQIARDTVAVTRVLALHVLRRRAVRGGFVAVPFEHGAVDDPRASARRALSTVAVTTSPNAYVIGIDPDHDFLFAHQLVRDPKAIEQLLRAR